MQLQIKALVAASMIAVACIGSANAKGVTAPEDLDDVDCSQQQDSMIGMKVCAARKLDEAEKQLAANRKKALKAADKAARNALTKLFKASDVYTEALCTAEAQSSEGGSIYSLVYGMCRIGETERQIKVLDGMVNRPEGS
ncbi:lysozyme inhibitor LprI family protein [Paracidovorax wautersii]|uniref:Lysozyme inhibitor LprI-like N-terminal domain-containing protein n=1 Tax=Paracidovorax wautersii TaxID=1177982 RepID=A0A1I2I157_9BURK|nr:lysozyme inhibitor LprI family protein [Paracidovorax wautersii]SFF34817.1 Protein of unknown function [Paracidovorax wautersii]